MFDISKTFALSNFVSSKEIRDSVAMEQPASLLTVRGKAYLVVQNVESYQSLMELAGYAERMIEYHKHMEENDSTF